MQALLADVDADQLTALALFDLEGRSQRYAARHLGIMPETLKERSGVHVASAGSRLPAP